MALTLYDNATSSNALKVRFLLAELGLDARRIEIPLSEPRPAWYRAIHPFATVPCLVDGGLALIESNTILRYLADREARDDLYPRDAAARARVDVLLDALGFTVRPVLWAVEERILYGVPGDPAAQLGALGDVLDAWDGLLAADGYATGAFSIADCAIAGRLVHLDELPLDPDRWPRTRRLLAVARARPAYAAAITPGGAPRSGR